MGQVGGAVGNVQVFGLDIPIFGIVHFDPAIAAITGEAHNGVFGNYANPCSGGVGGAGEDANIAGIHATTLPFDAGG